MIDKRKLRLILPCEDYGICWIKGAHIYDENEALEFLQSRKYFKDSIISAIEIDEHAYCFKMFQKDCSNPYDWICEGDYAWMECSKELKGAVPYTGIQYQAELRRAGEP
jgi:hypothetical protein